MAVMEPQPGIRPQRETAVATPTVATSMPPAPDGGTDRAPVISTHGLSKDYKTVKALSGLDLSVPHNSIFGFLGPNGSGKTTTIKLLLGLIKPTAGSGTGVYNRG